MATATTIAFPARTHLTTAFLVNKILTRLLCLSRSAWKCVLLASGTKEVSACHANRLAKHVPGIQMSAQAVTTL